MSILSITLTHAELAKQAKILTKANTEIASAAIILTGMSSEDEMVGFASQNLSDAADYLAESKKNEEALCTAEVAFTDAVDELNARKSWFAGSKMTAPEHLRNIAKELLRQADAIDGVRRKLDA